MTRRKVAANRNRERILLAARALLLSQDFSEFSMETVARQAGVSRLTLYYQFKSKAGLLEALNDFIARRGEMGELAEAFRAGDPIRTLHEFIRVLAGFWDSDRELIRRLRAVGSLDSEVGRSLAERNERRRHGCRVIIERYYHWYPMLPEPWASRAVDTLQMLTSFETFDTLAVSGRKFDEVVQILHKQAYAVINYTPPSI
ncbi:MAG TPA: TetR/AcrR family transcriptional regulator [Candidatus Sulfotelmatobacter sp.]|nr:TetR/AcrR family transcriptional regulator [Candidatus Sulfotelmatobacter sp.]